ncbi:uncharacterized protein [Aristolochia californica]|uniref:uncharacterized protein n=1 Tax=Aristolochia californica TaxID=171875 RepID=UPI0035DBE612
MGVHGYRPPQFSQDTVWLPAWLQPHQINNSHLDSQTLIHLAHKDVVMTQHNVNSEPMGSSCPQDGTQLNSLHLFLSGGSSLPVTETPPSEDVLQLQLHLSSIGITQDPSSVLWNTIPTESPEPNNKLPIQPLPSTSKDHIEQKDVLAMRGYKSPGKSFSRKNRKKKQKKFNDAVELSIAASEALIISELVKCDDTSELFPASAVVEVTLKLKQARNQHCSNLLEETSACQPDQVDETAQLHELDENCMGSAFEDIGLSMPLVFGTSEGTSLFRTYHSDYCPKGENLDVECGCGSFASSRLSDTHAREDGNKANEEANKYDTKAQEMEFVGDSCENKLDGAFPIGVRSVDLPQKAADVRQVRHTGPSSCCISFKEIHVSAIGVTQIPPKVRVLAKDVGNKLCGVQKSGKSIPSPFVEETSFLSESVDVVTDENSVQIQVMEPLSSCENTDGALVSQDYIGSSNFSLVEPLCSVVPCSLSSYDGQVGDAARVPDEKSMQEHVELEILHQRIISNAATLPTSVSFPAREECSDGKGSGSISWKKLSSLRSYSTMGLNSNDVQKGAILVQDRRNPLKGKNNTINNPAITQSLKPIPNYQDSDESQKGGILNQKGYGELRKESMQKLNLEPRVIELNSGLYDEERCLPLVLNRGIRRRLQTCNTVTSNLAEKSLQRDSSPHKRARLFNCKDDTSCGNQTKVTSPAPNYSDFDVWRQIKEPSIRKRVHFLDDKVKPREDDVTIKPPLGFRIRSHTETNQRLKQSHNTVMLGSGEKKTNCPKSSGVQAGKTLIFQGLEFLLTGYVSHKQRELAMLIRKNGGVVLDDIPPPLSNFRRKRRLKIKKQRLPFVISPGKVQTKTFLYGCAVKAVMLKTKWLTDSVNVGYILPLHKYLILSHQAADRRRMIIGHSASCRRSNYIFESIGIMVYGKPSFCMTFGNIIKHGGGQVFKTLHWLVQSLKSGKNTAGAIVVEDESGASRHLRQCALEQNIPVMPVSWIVGSLYSGILLPLKKNDISPLCVTNETEIDPDVNLSIEI